MQIMRFLPALDFEDLQALIHMHHQVFRFIRQPIGFFHHFDFVNPFILRYLFQQNGFFRINVRHPQVAQLVRRVEFLKLIVPENGGVHHFILVADTQEFGVVRSVETLQLLVEWDGEDEVGLCGVQDLDYPYSVDARRLFCEFEDAVAPPIFGRAEHKDWSLGVSGEDSEVLADF